MVNNLAEVLNKIGEEYKPEINPNSNTVKSIDIGAAAVALGYYGVYQEYHGKPALIPIKEIKEGFKPGVDFHTNGTDLHDHVQLQNGIIVPEQLAKEAGLIGTRYSPHRTMAVTLR